MARGSQRGSSFKGKVSFNISQREARASSYGHLLLPKGVQVYREEKGRMSLDVVPYVVTDSHHPDCDAEHDVAVKGGLWYKRPYRLHRNIGADNGKLVCPTSIGKKCPICEYRQKLLNEGKDWKDDSIRALRASDRNLYYVVPLGERELDEVPHIWDISDFVFQEKLKKELQENEVYEVFPDPQDGLTLRIRFADEKIGTNTFISVSRIDFEARKHRYTDAVIDGLASLDDVLVIKDYKEIERLFFESGDPEDAGDDDADDRRPSARSARTPRDDDDDDKPRTSARTSRDDDDDDDDDAPKKEPEKPSMRRRTTSEPEKEPEPEKDEREARRAARAERDKPKDENKCPHGHRFGVDTDKKDECTDCKIWGDCLDELEKREAAD